MRFIDVTGQRFGRLVAIERVEASGRVHWFCRCDCGQERIVAATALRSGNSRSCGCSRRKGTFAEKVCEVCGAEMIPVLDVEDSAYVVPARWNKRRYCSLECAGRAKRGESYDKKRSREAGKPVLSDQRCACGCGKLTLIGWDGTPNEYRHGHAGDHGRTHGGTDTATYSSFNAMKARCLNPRNSHWLYYGGRGVTVCDRWLGADGFANFLADLGERPKWAKGGLDRIDPDGNYEPGNCRWATVLQQARNKRPRTSWRQRALTAEARVAELEAKLTLLGEEVGSG